MRFALLVVVVLLLGGGVYWWYGPGQPDPVRTLISQLPEPAADMVTFAVTKAGYQLPGQGTDLPQSGESSGARGDSDAYAVPSPELVDPAARANVSSAETDPTGTEGPSAPAGTASGDSTARISLKLDSGGSFKSLPRIKAALFSESRRLVIYYPLDRYDLTPAAKDALGELSASLSDAERLFALRIDGHCDDTGDDAYNQRLSERRAEAARDYLAEQGLSAESTVIRGFGERIPAYSSEGEGARARNRRAEIWVEWVETRRTDAPAALLPDGD